MQVRRILLATDFSECSADAARCACFLAQALDAELHILYVLEDAQGKLPVPTSAFPAADQIEREITGDSSAELGEILGADLNGLGRVVRATQRGAPAAEIVRYAERNQVDMIVVGTHGRSGIGHLILGSIAESVVRKATCPVLTVHPDQGDQ